MQQEWVQEKPFCAELVVLEVSKKPSLCWSRVPSKTLPRLSGAPLQQHPFVCAPAGEARSPGAEQMSPADAVAKLLPLSWPRFFFSSPLCFPPPPAGQGASHHGAWHQLAKLLNHCKSRATRCFWQSPCKAGAVDLSQGQKGFVLGLSQEQPGAGGAIAPVLGTGWSLLHGVRALRAGGKGGSCAVCEALRELKMK